MINTKYFLLSCLIGSLLIPGYTRENNPKKSQNTEMKNESIKRNTGLLFILEETLKNNKKIKAMQHELMQVHENSVQVSSSMRPQVKLGGGYDYGKRTSWGHDEYVDPQSSHNSTKNMNLTIQQNIFNGFADIANMKEVDKSIRAKWAEYEFTKQKTLLEVSSLYFEIIALQKELIHVEALLKSRESSLNVASAMEKTGAAKESDVSNAMASFSETTGQLEKVRSEITSKKAQFFDMTGIEFPSNTVELISNPKILDTNLTESEVFNIAIKENPQILMSIYKLDAAKESIKKPNPGFRPSVDLSYQWSQSLDSASKSGINKNYPNQSRDHTVGLRVSVPIYDGGVGRSQKRQAIDIATKSAIEKDDTINNVKTEITTVFATIKYALASISSNKQAIEARTHALHDTEEEYKAGIKIITDVLDAQQKLYEAQSGLIQAEKYLTIAKCNMLAILGRMNAKYLKLNYFDFDYVADYNETKRKM